jgi:hypothetical protein
MIALINCYECARDKQWMHSSRAIDQFVYQLPVRASMQVCCSCKDRICDLARIYSNECIHPSQQQCCSHTVNMPLHIALEVNRRL